MSSQAPTQPVAGAPPRRSSIRGLLLSSVLMVVVLTVLLGVVYPLVMTGLAQVFFHDQANGSLVKDNQGQVVGSKLIGQSFTKPQYFHGRASAAGNGYDATSSGGTNLGPTSKTLLKNTVALANKIRQENGLPPNYPLPSDAVSTSASGLDPDISPAYAALQVPRVARARGLSQATVRALVKKYTSDRTLGFMGQPRVNVLELNMALDGLKR
ncbi:MAG: potassium-transporting ATPase subunit KdpC [Chloroflexi bacterium]|nr:potassium-transporting ATPase subunit KdpC [Chloroflexota bacterium]